MDATAGRDEASGQFCGERDPSCSDDFGDDDDDDDSFDDNDEGRSYEDGASVECSTPPEPLEATLASLCKFTEFLRRYDPNNDTDTAEELAAEDPDACLSAIQYHLANPENRTGEERHALLSALENLFDVFVSRSCSANEGDKPQEARALLREMSLDLAERLFPYLEFQDTRATARRLIHHVAEHGNPREIWLGVLQACDASTPISAAQTDADVDTWETQVETVTALVNIIATVIPRIQTKKPLSFLSPTARAIRRLSRALCASDPAVLKHEELVAGVTRLVESASALAARCAASWKDMHPAPALYIHPVATESQRDLTQKRQLAAHMMLTCLEFSVSFVPLKELSPMFAARRTLETSTLVHFGPLEVIKKLLHTAVKDFRLNLVELVDAYLHVVSPSQSMTSGHDLGDEEFSTPTDFIEPSSILSCIVPMMIAEERVDNAVIDMDAAARGFWPLLVANPISTARGSAILLRACLKTLVPEHHHLEALRAVATFRYILAKATGPERCRSATRMFIFNGSDIDLDHDGEKGTMTDQSKCQTAWELPRHHGRCAVDRLVVLLASFASRSPDSDLRYTAFRAVAELLAVCAPEVRAILIDELLGPGDREDDRTAGCPYHNVQAASVDLLKEAVSDAFGAGTKQTLFNSSFVIEKFFPALFYLPAVKRPPSASPPDIPDALEREPRTSRDGSTVKSFFELDYPKHAQAANFLIYLLIVDKGTNMTGVWDVSNVKRLQKEFVNPLRQWVAFASRQVKEISGQEDRSHIAMSTNVLDMTLDRVNELLSSPA